MRLLLPNRPGNIGNIHREPVFDIALSRDHDDLDGLALDFVLEKHKVVSGSLCVGVVLIDSANKRLRCFMSMDTSLSYSNG